MTGAGATVLNGRASPGKADVVLIGDGPTATAALRSLLTPFNVACVLRTSGDLPEEPVCALAGAAGVPVRPVQGLEDIAAAVGDLRPAAVVISSFNRILPPPILDMSRFVNVHYSLLPLYRGRANVNWAIINGEPTVGISIHRVEPELDGGDVLYQEAVSIGPHDSVTSLYERLNAIQERKLGAAVLRAIEGARGVPQNQAYATYGCSRSPADGEIDWRRSTVAIDRLIRALTSPFPGAFTHLDGAPVEIRRAEPVRNAPVYSGRIPGRVVGRSKAEGWVDVLTGDGVLRIFEMAPSPGSRLSIDAAALVTSTKLTLGLSQADLLRRIIALERRLAALTPPA